MHGVINFRYRGSTRVHTWECSHNHRDGLAAFECAVREARRRYLQGQSRDNATPNAQYSEVTVTARAAS